MIFKNPAMPLNLLVIDALTELQSVPWTEFLEPSTRVTFEPLPRFGEIFKTDDIEEALHYAVPLVLRTCEQCRPDCIVVHSKGVAIVTYLFAHNLYSGAALILSPIPNKCDHLGLDPLSNDEDPWGAQWAAVLNILRGRTVAFGVGNSADEEVLIHEYLKPAAAERPNWLLRQAQGDHDWVCRSRNRRALRALLDWLADSKM
jgi:hypothetical protein